MGAKEQFEREMAKIERGEVDEYYDSLLCDLLAKAKAGKPESIDICQMMKCDCGCDTAPWLAIVINDDQEYRFDSPAQLRKFIRVLRRAATEVFGGKF